MSQTLTLASSNTLALDDAPFVSLEIHEHHIEIMSRQRDIGDDVDTIPQSISVPFAPTSFPAKGIARTPPSPRPMDDKTRTTILTAIVKARGWIDAMLQDSSIDFAAIAKKEALAERHVRFLTPLAYISPHIIEAIADGRAPADMTVSTLARALPMNWVAQESAAKLG